MAPQPQADYLVRITTPKTKGTGILIAPDLVLCCAHEVESARTAQVHIAGHAIAAKVEHREYDPKKQRDLALLRLDREVTALQLPWLVNLFKQTPVRLRGHWQGEVVSAETQVISVRHIESKARILSFDVDPAALEEMSGGVALVQICDQTLCVGLIRKGGEDSWKSIIIGEGEVSRFLEGRAALPIFPHHRPATPTRPPNPDLYFKSLREECGTIRPWGMKEAHRVPIARVFIPLRTRVSTDRAEQRDIPLLQAVNDRRNVLITGSAGSGKTTFVKRLALALAPNHPHDPKFDPRFRGFPMYVRVSELEAHIAARHGQPNTYTDFSDPRWIAHYLGAGPSKLDESFFEDKLASDDAVLLLDGLDEASGERRRAQIAKLFRHAALMARCRFVVTTRPEAFQKDVHLPDFASLPIEDLNRAEIAGFLLDWYRCLHEDNEDAARDGSDKLLAAIGNSRPEILRLATNPLMLTSLAIVHWNKGRLPEGRADLYDSVLTWLAESAKDGDQPCPPKDRLRRLALLAFRMQANRGGQRQQVDLGTASTHIAPDFHSHRPVEDARDFLEREQTASGIVTLREGEIRFWHRSFQEYLAARHLHGSDGDEVRRECRKYIYVPEWREPIQLLCGQWAGDSRGRLNALLTDLVKHAAGNRPLPRKACAAGILGAVLADLAPAGYQLPEAAQAPYRALLDEVMAIFNPGAHALIGIKDRIAAADALALAGDPRLRNASWIPIPAGSFTMGSENDDTEAADSEKPPKLVEISKPFLIGRFPVTVEEYRRYLEDPKHEEPIRLPEEWDEQLRHPSRPVVYVSWEEAVLYCKHFACRLPTEQEWEYAARGQQSRRYPWGNQPLDQTRANYDNAVGHPTPVGLYPEGETPEGVADMAGNVWEWTQTPWDKYYVLRGGCFANEAKHVRSACRSRG